jgi:hypothetical protein
MKWHRSASMGSCMVVKDKVEFVNQLKNSLKILVLVSQKPIDIKVLALK